MNGSHAHAGRSAADAAALGAILAGGRNRRYGAHKALAEVAGRRIIDRVRHALGSVLSDLVLVANEPEVYAPVGLPMRPDARAGMGVLGGIHTALLWAREAGRAGALTVACDMPFLSAPLLRRLVDDATATGADAVAPASENRRGLEPLCAYYSVACIDAIEAAFTRGDRHVVAFFPDVRLHRVPLDDVHAFGDPDTLFLNVNTPEQRERAERIAGAGGTRAAEHAPGDGGASDPAERVAGRSDVGASPAAEANDG